MNQAAYKLILKWSLEIDFGRKMWLEGEVEELGEALNRDAATRRENMSEEMSGRPQDTGLRSRVRELLLQGKKQPAIRKETGAGDSVITAVRAELKTEGKWPVPKVEKPKRKGKKS